MKTLPKGPVLLEKGVTSHMEQKNCGNLMSELFDVFFRCFAIPLDLYLDPFVVFPNTKKKAQTILVTILVPHWQFALFILVFGTCRLWTLNINTFYHDRYNQGRSSKNDG